MCMSLKQKQQLQREERNLQQKINETKLRQLLKEMRWVGGKKVKIFKFTLHAWREERTTWQKTGARQHLRETEATVAAGRGKVGADVC